MNCKKRHWGKALPAHSEQDGFAKHFGTTIPTSIPESSAWWNMQAREPPLLSVRFLHSCCSPEQPKLVSQTPSILPESSRRIALIPACLRRLKGADLSMILLALLPPRTSKQRCKTDFCRLLDSSGGSFRLDGRRGNGIDAGAVPHKHELSFFFCMRGRLSNK